MNILITRPLIDSEDLMGKLFSMGHKIIQIPTLKIFSSNADSRYTSEHEPEAQTTPRELISLIILSLFQSLFNLLGLINI
jgi:hypothetical protein